MKTRERRLIYKLIESIEENTYLSAIASMVYKGLSSNKNMTLMLNVFLSRLISFVNEELREVDVDMDVKLAVQSFFRTGYIDGYVHSKKEAIIFEKLFLSIWGEEVQVSEEVAVATTAAAV
ncbi:MAG: hypothetical protein N4A44_03175 [Alphaproteobacteria bacterium]|nr:hypothetical protein [Alphaproteobacteria bacterium]